MSAETWTAIIAGATFMVFWTATILGLASWISKQFGYLRKDFDAKHLENNNKFEKVFEKITRHETLLSVRRGR